MLTGEFTAKTTFRALRGRGGKNPLGVGADTRLDKQIPMAMDGANAQDQTKQEVPSPDGSSDWGARLRDFLTDGSVSALCDELGRLMGVPIWLRDHSGADGKVEAIIPVWSDEGPVSALGKPTGEGHPWSFVAESVARKRAFSQVNLADDGSHETVAVPLRITTGVLGAIVMCLPREAMRADGVVGTGGAAASEAYRLQSIRRSVLLLASSVCDVCEAQVALKKRVRELDALYRLSALLTAAGTPEQLLDAALDLAIEVLRVDAGSIAVFEDGAGKDRVPVVRSARGLSREWITDQRPLSGGGVLRHRALAGEVVSVEDLASDPSIVDHARVEAEGLKSMLSTGLLDRETPVGVIRLFTRTPRIFNEQENELLRAIAEHLASGITTAGLRRMRAQDEQIQRQVRLAADVQRRMLPRSLPQVPPFDVAAHYAPSFELGGDFYDFMVLGGHLGILIGDVVGKGVAAALLMSSVRAGIRAHAQDLYHIDEVLSRTNRALSADTLDNEFATVWFGVADPTTLRLTYCGAGHDWPLLVRMPRDRAVEDKDVQRLTADGMALGIDPSQKYPKGMFQLERGDVLVTFTDGLHDALNFEGKRFGGTRLRKSLVDLLATDPDASAARIVDHVIARVRQHTGLNRRVDDITVVVMRVGG
jgi:sigma-B regulation protein RsbU (phosphoserine phosphatase)